MLKNKGQRCLSLLFVASSMAFSAFYGLSNISGSKGHQVRCFGACKFFGAEDLLSTRVQ